jgi:hypothetical protein
LAVSEFFTFEIDCPIGVLLNRMKKSSIHRLVPFLLSTFCSSPPEEANVMRNLSTAFAAAAILAFATPAVAGLLGSTVTGTASTTGGAQVSATNLGTTTVGAGPEFGFCLGPPVACGANSGVSVSVDITDTGVNFGFAGSTNSFSGTFSVLLSNFSRTIGGVTLASGAFDSFALTSFGANQMLFTGSTTNGFNAIGGVGVSFNVTVPEPGTLLLLGIGIAGLAAGARRKRVA